MAWAILAVLSGCNKDTVVISYRTLATFNKFYNPSTGYGSAGALGELHSVYQIESIDNQGQNATPFTFCVKNLTVEGNPSSFYGNTELVGSALLLAGAKSDYFIDPSFCETVQPGERKEFDQSHPVRIVIRHPYNQGEETVDYQLKHPSEDSGRQIVLNRLNPAPFYVPEATPYDLPNPVTSYDGFWQTPETGPKLLAVWSDQNPYYCWVVDPGEWDAIAITNGWTTTPANAWLSPIAYNRPGDASTYCPWPDGMFNVGEAVYLVMGATRTTYGTSCHLLNDQQVENHGGWDRVWDPGYPADQVKFWLASNYQGDCTQ